MAREISNSDDTIDMRDVTDRVEELAALRDAEDPATGQPHGLDRSEREELEALQTLLEDTRGNGGDHEWEGDWYPGYLIRDSYFVDAMRELVSDIGDLPADVPSYIAIDWEQTAENLREDYSSVEFDGMPYWYR